MKRFLRSKLLGRNSYMNVEAIKERFCDASSYHGLNTAASIRITNNLFAFTKWMMNKCYPTSVLDITPVKAVRGDLPNGSHYWSEYISEGNEDINITLDDFKGEFNPDEYLANVSFYTKRAPGNAPVVIFFRMNQGMGKSTTALALATEMRKNGCKVKIIEQDLCWGHTMSCQAILYHEINDSNGG